jgi:hypothetical protein
MCRDAYGSVLFIDEAYSLYRGDGNERDFGREALETLIAEMENHRNDLVVIMAGYTDDMETLMKGNAGLASRMPYVIEFPNFNRDELYRIYLSMIEGQFAYDEDLLPAVRAYFDALPDVVLDSKEFSNARFVRNLFERTWAKAAMRCQRTARILRIGILLLILSRDTFPGSSGVGSSANCSSSAASRLSNRSYKLTFMLPSLQTVFSVLPKPCVSVCPH